MKTFSKLDSMFGVEDTDPSPASIPTASQITIEDDAELARKTLRDLIAKGEKALEGILRVAENSEHPRAYEVSGQMIKSVSDLAKDLLEIQKRKQDLAKKDPDAKKNNVTNNNLIFAGSTQELLKVLRQEQESFSKPPLAIAGEVIDAEIIED
jgi:hypothetical protein